MDPTHQGDAIFSTHLGRFPPRTELPSSIVLRSSPEDDHESMVATLRRQFPQQCRAITAPIVNIYQWFDPYDAHRHGSAFLHSVLVAIAFQNTTRAKQVQEFADHWRIAHPTHFDTIASQSLEVFTDMEIEEYGYDFLADTFLQLTLLRSTVPKYGWSKTPDRGANRRAEPHSLNARSIGNYSSKRPYPNPSPQTYGPYHAGFLLQPTAPESDPSIETPTRQISNYEGPSNYSALPRFSPPNKAPFGPRRVLNTSTDAVYSSGTTPVQAPQRTHSLSYHGDFHSDRERCSWQRHKRGFSGEINTASIHELPGSSIYRRAPFSQHLFHSQPRPAEPAPSARNPSKISSDDARLLGMEEVGSKSGTFDENSEHPVDANQLEETSLQAPSQTTRNQLNRHSGSIKSPFHRDYLLEADPAVIFAVDKSCVGTYGSYSIAEQKVKQCRRENKEHPKGPSYDHPPSRQSSTSMSRVINDDRKLFKNMQVTLSNLQSSIDNENRRPQNLDQHADHSSQEITEPQTQKISFGETPKLRPNHSSWPNREGPSDSHLSAFYSEHRPRDRLKLFVKGLPVKFSSSCVRQLFDPRAKIVDITNIKTNQYENRESWGYAFVKFEDADDAANAIKVLDSTYPDSCKGRRLLVKYAYLGNPKLSRLRMESLSQNVSSRGITKEGLVQDDKITGREVSPDIVVSQEQTEKLHAPMDTNQGNIVDSNAKSIQTGKELESSIQTEQSQQLKSPVKVSNPNTKSIHDHKKNLPQAPDGYVDSSLQLDKTKGNNVKRKRDAKSNAAKRKAHSEPVVDEGNSANMLSSQSPPAQNVEALSRPVLEVRNSAAPPLSTLEEYPPLVASRPAEIILESLTALPSHETHTPAKSKRKKVQTDKKELNIVASSTIKATWGTKSLVAVTGTAEIIEKPDLAVIASCVGGTIENSKLSHAIYNIAEAPGKAKEAVGVPGVAMHTTETESETAASSFPGTIEEANQVIIVVDTAEHAAAKKPVVAVSCAAEIPQQMEPSITVSFQAKTIEGPHFSSLEPAGLGFKKMVRDEIISEKKNVPSITCVPVAENTCNTQPDRSNSYSDKSQILATAAKANEVLQISPSSKIMDCDIRQEGFKSHLHPSAIYGKVHLEPNASSSIGNQDYSDSKHTGSELATTLKAKPPVNEPKPLSLDTTSLSQNIGTALVSIHPSMFATEPTIRGNKLFIAPSKELQDLEIQTDPQTLPCALETLLATSGQASSSVLLNPLLIQRSRPEIPLRTSSLSSPSTAIITHKKKQRAFTPAKTSFNKSPKIPLAKIPDYQLEVAEASGESSDMSVTCKTLETVTENGTDHKESVNQLLKPSSCTSEEENQRHDKEEDTTKAQQTPTSTNRKKSKRRNTAKKSKSQSTGNQYTSALNINITNSASSATREHTPVAQPEPETPYLVNDEFILPLFRVGKQVDNTNSDGREKSLVKHRTKSLSPSDPISWYLRKKLKFYQPALCAAMGTTESLSSTDSDLSSTSLASEKPKEENLLVAARSDGYSDAIGLPPQTLGWIAQGEPTVALDEFERIYSASVKASTKSVEQLANNMTNPTESKLGEGKIPTATDHEPGNIHLLANKTCANMVLDLRTKESLGKAINALNNPTGLNSDPSSERTISQDGSQTDDLSLPVRPLVTNMPVEETGGKATDLPFRLMYSDLDSSPRPKLAHAAGPSSLPQLTSPPQESTLEPFEDQMKEIEAAALHLSARPSESIPLSSSISVSSASTAKIQQTSELRSPQHHINDAEETTESQVPASHDFAPWGEHGQDSAPSTSRTSSTPSTPTRTSTDASQLGRATEGRVPINGAIDTSISSSTPRTPRTSSPSSMDSLILKVIPEAAIANPTISTRTPRNSISTTCIPVGSSHHEIMIGEAAKRESSKSEAVSSPPRTPTHKSFASYAAATQSPLKPSASKGSPPISIGDVIDISGPEGGPQRALVIERASDGSPFGHLMSRNSESRTRQRGNIRGDVWRVPRGQRTWGSGPTS